MSKVDFLRRGETIDSLRVEKKKKVAGAEREREINNVGDSRNEDRKTFFKKPGW